MTHFDDIYDIAIGNYGLITAAQAREQGITAVELNRWCKIGRLKRRDGRVGCGTHPSRRVIENPCTAKPKERSRPGG